MACLLVQRRHKVGKGTQIGPGSLLEDRSRWCLRIRRAVLKHHNQTTWEQRV